MSRRPPRVMTRYETPASSNAGLARAFGNAAPAVHVGRAGEQLGDVDARCGSREQPHRAQDRQRSDRLRRDREVAKAFVVHDLSQRPFRRAGGDDDVTLVLDCPELPEQTVAHDHERRHGLGRIAGSADDVEERTTRLEAIEQCPEPARIDRVRDVDPHPARRRRVAPFRRRERGGEHVRAEGGVAGADHDEIVELPAHLFRESERALQIFGGIGELRERQRTRTPLCLEGRLDVGEARQQRLEVAVADAGVADDVRHHAVQVDARTVLLAPALALEGPAHRGASNTLRQPSTNSHLTAGAPGRGGRYRRRAGEQSTPAAYSVEMPSREEGGAVGGCGVGSDPGRAPSHRASRETAGDGERCLECGDSRAPRVELDGVRSFEPSSHAR